MRVALEPRTRTLRLVIVFSFLWLHVFLSKIPDPDDLSMPSLLNRNVLKFAHPKPADRKFKRLFHAAPPAPPALAGPAAPQALAGRLAPRPPRGLQPSGTRGRRSGRMQAAEHRFDHYVLLHIFHPPCEPCASPPTVPPQTPLLQLPCQPRDPCRAWRGGAPTGGVRRPRTPSAVTICRQLSPPIVTVCRAVEPPSAQPVTCRAGRDLTPHGRRAAGRVERWHEKYLLKDLDRTFVWCQPAGCSSVAGPAGCVLAAGDAGRLQSRARLQQGVCGDRLHGRSQEDGGADAHHARR